MTNTVLLLQKRYAELMHGMQSGVAAKMAIDASETSAKHLRVGVNSAMVEHSALTLLLIEKGIISELEYWHAMVQAAERERTLYEDWLSNATGKNVTLR